MIGAPPRVGIFGLLGSGNLGNDAAFEVVLNYLRRDHPDAVVDAMCGGPQRMKGHYGLDAVPILWYDEHSSGTTGARAVVLKVVGKAIDAFRTGAWVRRHDVVIVPGAGAQEATLPIRATGVPYSMFLLSASGRLFGTKVALVSVGANRMNQRMTRWLFNAAARMAFYRSYRDHHSKTAMLERGVDAAAGDPVYPDLVFGLPSPSEEAGDPGTVGVGLMAYFGGNDDRREAARLHEHYVDTMKSFVRWLVDSGHRVRLFWGDNKDHVDGVVVQSILEDLRRYRPDLGPSMVVAEPFSSPEELLRELGPIGIFVGTRYHNVVSALKLSKPTISIGYSSKFDVLMADMGLSAYCQAASSVELDRLVEQFTEIEEHVEELRHVLLERNRAIAADLDHQFSRLTTSLFPDRRRRLEPVA
ncbi:MAG: polysaccharide pyruvyl transferase family protein [Acidimicrobiaceae bacterium]|nr:polysaccharide pyruvyl transferase family protein [Acidimicrobiaceae bacterium]